jgi:hypothetical protein
MEHTAKHTRGLHLARRHLELAAPHSFRSLTDHAHNHQVMNALPLLLIIAAIGWFWLDSLRAREIATEISKTACRQHHVQFLDQTVALHKLGLRWLTQGLRFRRVYRFDYNESDEGRRTGYLVMLGQQLLEISMGLPDDAQDA